MCDVESDLETNESTRSGRALEETRLERIASYTLTTLRLKQDKWLKMMANEQFRLIVLDWLNNTHRRTLVIALSPGGHLIPKNALNDLCHNYAMHTTATAAPSVAAVSNATADASTAMAAAAVAAASAVVAATALLVPLPPPSSSFSTLDGVPRGKCVYFVRRDVQRGGMEPLTADNFHAQILCGDLPVHSKIETLAILCDEVFQPLLENPLNRKLWPEIVGQDLQARMKDVRNTLTEIKGKTNNRTVLSLLLPPTVIEVVATHVSQGIIEKSSACFARHYKDKISSLMLKGLPWFHMLEKCLQEKELQ